MDSKEFLDALNLVAKEKGIDFAVVAPDDPLVLGMVDALNAIGIPCFGPDKKAATGRDWPSSEDEQVPDPLL